MRLVSAALFEGELELVDPFGQAASFYVRAAYVCWGEIVVVPKYAQSNHVGFSAYVKRFEIDRS